MTAATGKPRFSAVMGGADRSILSVLLSLSWPIILTNQIGTVQATIMVLWVSRLANASGLAALTVANPLASTAFWFLAVVPAGTWPVVARMAGAEERDAGTLLVTSCGLQVLISVPFLMGGLMFLNPLSRWLGGDAGVGVVRDVHDYLLPICLSFPVAGAAGVLMSLILGTGRTRLGLGRAVASLAIEACLVPFFMLALAMGTEGASLATLVSEVILVIAFALLVWRRAAEFGLERAPDRVRPRFEGRLARKLLRVGIPHQGARVSMTLALLSYTHLVASDGKIAAAGFGIGITVFIACASLSLAISNGVAIMVGHFMGARRADRAIASVRCGAGVVAVIAIVTTFALPHARPVIALLSDEGGVVDSAMSSLMHMRWSFIGLALWQLLATSYAATGVNAAAGALLAIADAAAVLLAYALPMPGLVAASWAIVVQHLTRAALLGMLVRRSLLNPLAAAAEPVRPTRGSRGGQAAGSCQAPRETGWRGGSSR